MSVLALCKFTPLGFETVFNGFCGVSQTVCKFTPLGFETILHFLISAFFIRVNLPRWGLKPGDIPESHVSDKV